MCVAEVVEGSSCGDVSSRAAGAGIGAGLLELGPAESSEEVRCGEPKRPSAGDREQWEFAPVGEAVSGYGVGRGGLGSRLEESLLGFVVVGW